ncbi:MAG: hypothetical protein JWQ88_146 [Rhodoferax sp.]|nr:hypothetical protein [Rhodoferax sp.]
MLLIISGQYVESELSAEFGRIPPAFLPLGNQRLYAHQVGQLSRHYPETALTLPSDFELDRPDADMLASLDVRVCRTTTGSPLGAAVREALGHVVLDGRIDILYGDTLVYEDELGGTDWIAVGDSDEHYPWHYEGADRPASGPVEAVAQGRDGMGGEAWAGMFSFSSALEFLGVLEQCDDFIAAVTRYGEVCHPLERRSLKRWLDFGHVHTYFHSRLAVTTQRHFNHLRIEDGVVAKSSDDRRKMQAEASWFAAAPVAVRPYLPNFISAELPELPGSSGSSGSSAPPGHGAVAGYAIEYLPLVPLNELFVFGRLPGKVWRRIFRACDRFLCAARGVPVPAPIARATDGAMAERLYRSKTAERLTLFARQTGVDLDAPWRLGGRALPSLRRMAEDAADLAMAHAPAASFVHGDFCFSNILFDFRSDRVKLIDPRGLDADGRITPFGDFRYDVAKLAHSVLGLYDVIVAGRYTLKGSGHDIDFEVWHANPADIGAVFRGMAFAGRSAEAWDAQPIMVLLFLSMLPLHVDNPPRQRALMANALRLYQETCP